MVLDKLTIEKKGNISEFDVLSPTLSSITANMISNSLLGADKSIMSF